MIEDDAYADTRSRRAGDRDEWRERGHRFVRYLTSRSSESWLFFAAGLALGALFL